jgi:hypothetical protein
MPRQNASRVRILQRFDRLVVLGVVLAVISWPSSDGRSGGSVLLRIGALRDRRSA